MANSVCCLHLSGWAGRAAIWILLTMSLHSQPRVSFRGLPGSGADLVPPGTAEFRAAVARAVDPAGLAALQPVLPYLAIVKNNSAKAIVAVMLRYERVNRSGESSWFSSLWLTTQKLERRMARPGQSILMGPFGGFCRVLRDTLVMVDAQGASTDIWKRVAEFAENAEIRILLDAVVFEDGMLVGPDTAGLQAQLQAYIRAERELHESVLALSGDVRRKYLSDIAETTDLLKWLERNTPDAHYRIHRAGSARILLNLLDNAKTEEQFLTWERQIVGNSIPEPYREM